MLEAKRPRPIIPSSEAFMCMRNSKPPLNKNTVTIEFREDSLTFGKTKMSKEPQDEHVFRTFYNPKDTSYMHRYQRNRFKRTGRETALTDRNSIIGTPFSSLQAKDNQMLVPVLPSLDRQRYRYLLTAITGISKHKRLPDFKTPPNLKIIVNPNMESISPRNSPCEFKEIGSPKIINVSADFKPASRKGIKFQLDNFYQRITKNKQLLQKGRYNSFRQYVHPVHPQVDACLLGDEQLKVHQLSIRSRKRNKMERT